MAVVVGVVVGGADLCKRIFRQFSLVTCVSFRYVVKNLQQQRQTLEIVKDLACEAKTSEIFKDVALFMCSCLFCFLFFFVFVGFFFKKNSCFPMSRFLFFCLSFFVDFFVFSFFHFSVVREDAKKRKEKRRKVHVVKVTIFLCEDVIFGLGGQRKKVRKSPLPLLGDRGGTGPLQGNHACIFSCVFFFLLFLPFSPLFVLFLSLSNIFYCLHQYPSLAEEASAAVGAPWRCGVLTAGVGLGRQLGREHDAPPRGGVGWTLLAC